MMPRATKTPVPDIEMDTVWQGLIEGLKTPRDRRLAYVHVPFCTNHCLFCGFYRHRRRNGGSAAFADLVVEEVRHEAQAPGIATRPLQAVYLGSGTPTALAPVDTQRIPQSSACLERDLHPTLGRGRDRLPRVNRVQSEMLIFE